MAWTSWRLLLTLLLIQFILLRNTNTVLNELRTAVWSQILNSHEVQAVTFVFDLTKQWTWVSACSVVMVDGNSQWFAAELLMKRAVSPLGCHNRLSFRLSCVAQLILPPLSLINPWYKEMKQWQEGNIIITTWTRPCSGPKLPITTNQNFFTLTMDQLIDY